MITHASHLDRLLTGIHRRLVLRGTLRALAGLVLILVPTAIALACIDYYVRPASAGRLAELLLIVSLFTAFTARKLPALARLRPKHVSAARRVERFDPGLSGRLLSYVDLQSRTRYPSSPHAAASSDLIDAMGQQIDQYTTDFDLWRVVPLRPLRARVGLAIILLVTAFSLLAFQPRIASTWAARVFYPFSHTPWPTRTTIVGLESNYRVRRGDTLTITGQLAGKIPTDGEIASRPLDTNITAVSVDRLFIDSDGSFTAAIGPVILPTAIRVRTGDARSAEITVDPIDPPCIRDLSIHCHFPDYLHRPDEIMISRDLHVPVGTRVDLNVTADKPVRAMTLIVATKPSQDHRSFELSSPAHGTGSFIVRSPGWYAIQLEGDPGITEDRPPTYNIVPLENQYPSVRLKSPEADLSVTPTAMLPVEFEASDDFGIVSTSIVWQLRKPDSTTDPSWSRTPIPIESPSKTLNTRFFWNLAAANVQPGDIIRFQIAVMDAGKHIGPASADTGKSQTRSLRVLAPAVYLSEHLALLNVAFENIDRLATQVSAGWDEVSALIHLLKQHAAACPADAIARLKTECERQHNLVTQAKAIATELNHLTSEWSINMPTQTDTPEGTSLLARTMTDLAAGPMNESLIGLQAALDNCEQDSKHATVLTQLQKSQVAQTTVLKILASITPARTRTSIRQLTDQTGRPTPPSTESDFNNVQQTLADTITNTLKSTQLDSAQQKTTSTPKTKTPHDRPTRITGPDGQSSPTTTQEMIIIGGSIATSPPIPATAPITTPHWEWNLPPHTRAILEQAAAERYPSGQAAAIKRYYERLSRELNKQP